MHSRYEDILELAEPLGRKPLWWDENGVPRFAVHHPAYCPDIYADEVALLEICCQACGREQWVQMSRGAMDPYQRPMLSAQAADMSIHYGDPPWHADAAGELCHVGCTMNCYDLRVLQLWQRGPDTEWVRVPELERALPDAANRDVAELRRTHPENAPGETEN